MGRILAADDPTAIAAAADALEQGRLVVVPTDTVYGIAAHPGIAEAVGALFEAKGRPSDLALAVLVADLAQAADLADLTPAALRLARRFWPGALTIVVRRRPTFDADLGGDPGSLGLRMPHHDRLRELLRRTGPLVVTSANLSGRPTPDSVEVIQEIFGEGIAVYLDEGRLPGAPSTVVSVLTDPPAILREGAVSREQIFGAGEQPPRP